MTIRNPIPFTPRTILRRPDVEKRTGLKRAHLYKLIKLGQFPKQVKLSERAVGWDSTEVEQWIAERLQQKRA
jgi:prophage regulatory protein